MAIDIFGLAAGAQGGLDVYEQRKRQQEEDALRQQMIEMEMADRQRRIAAEGVAAQRAGEEHERAGERHQWQSPEEWERRQKLQHEFAMAELEARRRAQAEQQRAGRDPLLQAQTQDNLHRRQAHDVVVEILNDPGLRRAHAGMQAPGGEAVPEVGSDIVANMAARRRPDIPRHYIVAAYDAYMRQPRRDREREEGRFSMNDALQAAAAEGF